MCNFSPNIKSINIDDYARIHASLATATAVK